VRAVVQRVASAQVVVDGRVTGAIGRGLLVYLGVGRDDTDHDRAYVLRKVIGLRIFPDEASPGGSGKMTASVVDVGGSMLVVSQFTLYGDVRKGQRPSFDGAMAPAEARSAYELFVAEARAVLSTERVATGIFAADMQVGSVNDGPITILIDSVISPRPA
jgi:D-tyrosyl-tRNA(Tyr) deacylase